MIESLMDTTHTLLFTFAMRGEKLVSSQWMNGCITPPR